MVSASVVLADEQAPMQAPVWATLGATLPAVETPEGLILDLDPQFCAGANEALEQSINGWIAPARDLFPATDVLAPEGE
jgi:hypothetical protein